MTKNKLMGMFNLSHKMTVYIPTKDKNNNNLSNELINEMESHVGNELSKVNGGCTATDGIGYWRLPSGELCKEHVRMVFSYTNDVEKCLDACFELATYIKELANQDAVSIEYDQRLFII